MIPDGTYDNSNNFRRELYRNGEMVAFESARSVEVRRKIPSHSRIPAFGELIDVPKIAPRRCLSCGAVMTNDGVLPCDH